MKKTLCVILMIGMLLSLVACRNDKDSAETSGEDSQVTAETVGIVADGKSEYTIVWKSGAQKNEKAAALDLSEAIRQATGVSMSMAIDLVKPGEDNSLPAKSVVVGRLGYDEVKPMWVDLGKNDYTVTEKDGNVYLLGGSETAVYYAMKHFRENFVDDQTGSVTVPTGYRYSFEGADSREDYINDPDKLLLEWVSAFEVPEEMLDFEEKKTSFATPDGRMMCFAHRGDATHYPEDSIEGIISAVKMGADCIEVDVRMTSDGVPMLLHDEGLSRTTNYESVKGKVVNGIQLPTSDKLADWTFEQIRCLRLKSGNGGDNATQTDYVIPTLEEVLRVCGGHCYVLCDKVNTVADMKEIVLPLAKKLNAYKSIMFCGEMSITDAFTLRRDLKAEGVAEADLPVYLGKASCKTSKSWQTNVNQIKQGGMIPLFRFSGLSTVSMDGMAHLERMEEWLLAVKGTMRWQFDSQLGGDGSNETVELWDNAYGLGVNSMMVDNPLALCQYIAQNHFSK